MILAGLTLGRSHRHPIRNGNVLKCTSVPDFRRTRCSLQLGRVKWTSPRYFTHSFDSLHLGSDANLLGPREMNRKRRIVRYAAKIKRGGSDPTL